ncbi:MAG: sugar phosphate isomerase/epimerase family protein [Chloroflexota bacterium]
MLSIATDYSPHTHRLDSMADMLNGVGNPDPFLRAIAEAGFTHVHWCHHWSGDFLYTEPEMMHIGHLLENYGLQLADIHGSEGREKFWYSPQEYARQAGVELVKNRVDFCARFGGDAVVMHAYPLPDDPQMSQQQWDCLRRTLDDLRPYCLERGVKIAIENLIDFYGVHFHKLPLDQASDNWPLLERLFEAYEPDFLGLCYDSGHGNLGFDRMDGFEKVVDRLSVLHLNSNDGSGDQHHNLFVDQLGWERLAKLVADSPYDKPMSLEVMVSEQDRDEADFLQTAFKTGTEFGEMVKRLS